MKVEALIPFVAQHRKLILPREPAGSEHVYDAAKQLWVCSGSGEPVVLRHATRAKEGLAASQFGETTMTKTFEGVDQSEGRGSGAADSSGMSTSVPRDALSASTFGETLVTETAEGTDQPERTTSE